jgi:EAL domain-containing protein (putative c-di-GMP-specific phosphodiesterase class I)
MSLRRRGRLSSGRTQAVPSGPFDPKSVLTAIGATLYTWDLATDTIRWGPNAGEVLGLSLMGTFATGEGFAQAIEADGGVGRMDAIRQSTTLGDGWGVPFLARYALRLGTTRLVMVEDRGRWFPDETGAPAVVRGLMHVDAGIGDGFSAALRARTSLLSEIADDVAHARHSMTLVVGAADPGESDTRPLLTEIAARLRPLMRRRDRFIPYGSNRFALALVSCRACDAESALHRIVTLIGARTGSHRSPIEGLRLGAASAPDDGRDAQTLLGRAEAALAAAVDAPATAPAFAVYRADSVTAPRRPRPGTPAGTLVDALNERRLKLAYRPALDAHTGHLAFHGARFHLAEPGGRAAPAADIAEALEREGLSLLGDARAIELAADHLARHRGDRVALAISPATLKDAAFLPLLAAHLGARPGIESRLIVGCPEAVLADPATRGRFDAMKALGVAVALTGFGAGHASYKCLRSVPVDIVSIDGRLVEALSRSVADRMLVRGLVELLHHLGIAVAADCVEDAACARLLAEWGVDYQQGGHCGPPAVPATGRGGDTEATAVA